MLLISKVWYSGSSCNSDNVKDGGNGDVASLQSCCSPSTTTAYDDDDDDDDDGDDDDDDGDDAATANSIAIY